MKRPVSIYIGVLLLMLRVVSSIITGIAVALDWKDANLEFEGLTDSSGAPIDAALASGIVLGVVLVFYAAVVVIDGLIALLVYNGSTKARFLAMTVSSAVIVVTAVAFFGGQQQLTLENGGLWGLSLDILILVSLSSAEARQFSERHSDARRARRRKPRVAQSTP